MAKPYFRQVPNFEYISRNTDEQNISDYVPVKNFFKRGKLRDDIFGNLNFFEKYSIIGNERPDNVAFKYYNDDTLDWIVLLSNNILNIQSEWPMTQRTFDKVMLEKYGSYENLYSGIHHYETEEIRDSLGFVVLKSGIRVPPDWKTNGNFVEISNSSILFISSGDGVNPSTTVNVGTTNGIIGLEVGSEVIIDGVSEVEYNGRFVVTGISAFSGNIAFNFTFELASVPNIATPVLSTARTELISYVLPETTETRGNSYYYEFWDPGQGNTVLVPSSEFVRPITNYQYELRIEDDKRNIYVLKPRYLNVVFNDLDDVFPYKRGGSQFISPTLKRGDNIRLYT
jgi:hypothetical protein